LGPALPALFIAAGASVPEKVTIHVTRHAAMSSAGD